MWYPKRCTILPNFAQLWNKIRFLFWICDNQSEDTGHGNWKRNGWFKMNKLNVKCLWIIFTKLHLPLCKKNIAPCLLKTVPKYLFLIILKKTKNKKKSIYIYSNISRCPVAHSFHVNGQTRWITLAHIKPRPSLPHPLLLLPLLMDGQITLAHTTSPLLLLPM